MKKIKSQLLWLHRWLGIITGLVVFLVSLSGCIYVFEEELRATFQKDYLFVQPEGARKSVDQLLAIILTAHPKETITQLRFKEETNAAFIAITQSDKAISVNPYTGSILGVRNLKADLLTLTIQFHETLFLGDVGKEIIKWNVLIFFFLCITGLVLWWPKQKRFLRQALTIKWNAKFKRVNWDLHSVLGFYALIILVLISATGIFWTFDNAKKLVSFATGAPITKTKAPEVPKQTPRVYSWQAAYDYCKNTYPGAYQVFINQPPKPTEPLRVLMRYPYQVVRKQNTIFFHPENGQVLRADLFANYTAYDKVMRSNFDFHTGRIPALGLFGKLLYFFASLIATSLPVTGFIIWWGRGAKKKKPLKQPVKIELQPSLA
ncbi:MAG: PepSY domain-containing protein [Bacteroidetes bacterium]|nr:MAG: PepSY domain-containing protein [Bacteroidota bacterium]TAE72561.1 MAG: PepSY domain-containing protein [Bacteroidota bacterium]TAF91137.1 MAG: PepSY domain-containing protein [Bacteroidota bacterium]